MDDDAPAIGHNVGGIAADQLRSLVERVERLAEDRKALGVDINEVFAEAKSAGFDVKILRQVIRLRALGEAALQEQDAILDLYRRVLNV